MTESQIRFDDGAAYERMMGTWSRLVGEVFLDWLAPPKGLNWIDVGCGNGAFTEMLVDRCAPAAVLGVDPSPAQIGFARARPAARFAKFEQGDAMALSAAADSFDAAAMALVIFFVPDPAKSVAEMARVVRPGGLIAAYAWDLMGQGSPVEPIDREMRALGLKSQRALHPDVSRIEALQDLWAGAGLSAIETREIIVQRTFPDFDEFWTTNVAGTLLKHQLATVAPDIVQRLRNNVRASVPTDAAGRITHSARANAVRGRVPK